MKTGGAGRTNKGATRRRRLVRWAVILGTPLLLCFGLLVWGVWQTRQMEAFEPAPLDDLRAYRVTNELHARVVGILERNGFARCPNPFRAPRLPVPDEYFANYYGSSSTWSGQLSDGHPVFALDRSYPESNTWIQFYSNLKDQARGDGTLPRYREDLTRRLGLEVRDVN